MAKFTVRKRILICDDNEDILETLSVLLAQAGYETFIARNHHDFLNDVQNVNPDLVLLDVRMPERDGFWIAERLRIADVRAPIIFMTAYDSSACRLYAPMVGGAAYLPKPLDPDRLLRTIEKTIAAHPRADFCP